MANNCKCNNMIRKTTTIGMPNRWIGCNYPIRHLYMYMYNTLKLVVVGILIYLNRWVYLDLYLRARKLKFKGMAH